MTDFDCIVVGGGMVGASTALALADLGLKIALLEANPLQEIAEDDAFDLRVSAISLGSQQFLAAINAWPLIYPKRAAAYRRLGVWESDADYLEFNAEHIEQSHLGHIVENRLLQQTLWQQCQKKSNIELICPAKVDSIRQGANCVTLTIEQQQFKAKLVIAADGGNSQIRQMANIGVTGWRYQQNAMLINVQTALPQQDITWQQFNPSGPVAFLPMPGNRASLVWYHDAAEIKRLARLSNEQLTVEIKAHFPWKLDDITVENKGAFPLTRQHANQYVAGRVVLVGDAAHTINPLAGQGVNLGLKDVMGLKATLAEAIAAGQAWDSSKVLAHYEKLRRKDNLMMMTGMDLFYFAFSNDNPLLKSVRHFGLIAANKITPLKNKVLSYACGLE